MNDNDNLFDRTEALDKAFHGVLGVTGDTSVLVFADNGITLEADAQCGRNPLDQLGCIPFEDYKADVAGLVLEMDRDEFFGGPESRTYQVRLPVDTNLFTLLKTVSEGFEVTLNQHHIFLEGFELREVEGPFDTKPLLKLTPILGS